MAVFPERVPKAPTADLVTTEAEGETLVYDQLTHHIHHLNATSAAIWALCDGRRSLVEIAAATGISEELMQDALGKLAAAQLLAGELPTLPRLPVHSRRSFVNKAAIAGSVAVVVSVTAPMAAQATSHCTDIVTTCTEGTLSECCRRMDGSIGECGFSGDIVRCLEIV